MSCMAVLLRTIHLEVGEGGKGVDREGGGGLKASCIYKVYSLVPGILYVTILITANNGCTSRMRTFGHGSKPLINRNRRRKPPVLLCG